MIREATQKTRHISSIILMAAALATCSCHQSNPATNNPAPRADKAPAGPNRPAGFPPPVMNKPYPATGVVVQINRQEGWIEINHDEIKDLMPAMQMEFWVKNTSLLDQVKAGDHVDFTVVETESGEYLTELKKIQQPR